MDTKVQRQKQHEETPVVCVEGTKPKVTERKQKKNRAHRRYGYFGVFGVLHESRSITLSNSSTKAHTRKTPVSFGYKNNN